MTIRLLAGAAGYSANDIVTLDPATEAGLVAAKQATTSLAGGRVPPVPPRVDTASDARLVLRPDGVPRAIAGGNPDQWFPLVPAVARPNTVVLFGDSLMEQYNAATGYATSLTQTGGLATMVKSAHGLAVGDKFRVSGATDARYNRPYEVTAVIDSSTIQFLVDPDCPATSTGNPYIVFNHRTTSRCWAAHLNSRLDGRYQIINNAGIGGNTGAQMLARIQTDVLDFMPAEVWLNHGTNDVYAANLTVQQIIDTDKLIYDRLTTAGIIVRETSIPPRVGATAANIQKSLAVNRWRKEYWAGRSGGTYHDSYSPLVVATTGAVKTGVLWDGVHHSNLGGFLIAEAIAPDFGRPAPASSGLTSSMLDTYGTDATNRNIFDYPVMTSGYAGAPAGVATNTAGGAVPTGTVADGCKVNVSAGAGATVACSIVPRTIADDGDDYGNNQRLVITSTANGDQVNFETNVSMISRVAHGDVLWDEVTVRVDSPVNLKGLNMTMILQTATSGTVASSCEEFVTNDAAYPNRSFTKTFRVPATQLRTPASVHGAVTAVVAKVQAIFAGAGGATLNIAKLGIIKQ